MEKYMTQEAAIKSAWMILEGLGFSREINGDLENTVTAVYESAPTADVVEVRHGRWIEQPLDFDLCGVAYYQCSECGKEQQTPSNCCQFCGARMEGWKWCVWQDEDNEGVYCTAHIHEDRVLNCPYKNFEERQRADYPCQDYRPMKGVQKDGP